MNRFFRQLIPFLFIGVALVAISFGLILLAYLFAIGACIGLILFFFSWLRRKFFSPKTPVKPTAKSGRIIDSDDWKQL